MFDAVFIDADNTLFDFDRTQEKAIGDSAEHFQLNMNEANITVYESINRECWAQYDAGKIRNDEINERRWRLWLKATEQVGKTSPQLLADYYADSLSRQCEKEEGAEELIQYLRARVPVHIITNGFPSSQKHRWRLAGWEQYIQGITVSAVVGVKKPDPEIFNIAMNAVGVTDAARCLMIGDNLDADVRGPQNIGMRGCWYQRGDAENDTPIKPDFTVTHLSEIHPLF